MCSKEYYILLHGNKVVRGLHHQMFGNQERIHLIRLSFTDVVLPQGSRLDWVDNTYLEVRSNKIFYKVVAVVSR